MEVLKVRDCRIPAFQTLDAENEFGLKTIERVFAFGFFFHFFFFFILVICIEIDSSLRHLNLAIIK